MDLYKEIIIDLYYKCFPKRRFRDEVFNWSIVTWIFFIFFIITCCVLLGYILLSDNNFVVVSILYLLFLVSITLFFWSRGRDVPSLVKYLKIQERRIEDFDKKLKEQGVIKNDQICKIIDYFTYINELCTIIR